MRACVVVVVVCVMYVHMVYHIYICIKLKCVCMYDRSIDIKFECILTCYYVIVTEVSSQSAMRVRANIHTEYTSAAQGQPYRAMAHLP